MRSSVEADMFNSTPKSTTVICQILLTLFGIIFAAPLLVMFGVSLQGRGLGNYRMVLEQPYVPRFFLNSTFITVCTIVLVYFMTLLAAYAFAKLKFRGRSLLFSGVIVGLMIPGGALVVPIFLLFRALNLFDNYLAMILPITAGMIPFGVLTMRNWLEGLPDEILDAARIDGCTTFTTLRLIVMPLSKAISIVVIIWTFLSTWNDYFTALVYIRADEMLPLTHLPNFFIRREMTNVPDMGPIFASLVLISIPVMITYVLLQRYFEDGIVSGALK
jgi:raffinose/stachyose/melibiose transport system permease protein